MDTKFRKLDLVPIVISCVALAISLASLLGPRDVQAPSTKLRGSSGTWICQDATGGQVQVNNPANCGPDDLVLWCEVWETDPTGSGKCVD